MSIVSIKILNSKGEEEHDHYECSVCGTDLGGTFYPASSQVKPKHGMMQNNVKWTYCPWCGSVLRPEQVSTPIV